MQHEIQHGFCNPSKYAIFAVFVTGSNPVTPTFKRHNFYNWKLCLFSLVASKWHQKKENTLGIRLYKFSFFRVRYMGRMKSMYGNGYGLDTYISNERKEYST